MDGRLLDRTRDLTTRTCGWVDSTNVESTQPLNTHLHVKEPLPKNPETARPGTMPTLYTGFVVATTSMR